MYQKILLAVELIPENDEVLLSRAVQVAKENNAELFVVHVIEHLSNYGAAYGISAGIDIESMLKEEAEKLMVKYGQQLNVDRQHQFIELGPAKYGIVEKAKDIGADLIIVGSHGRHGVGLLLGSTANGVLHNAPCDVLAIRTPEEEA